ncbi:phage major capsid protein, partial [Pseudomonas paraeruginosa]
RQHQLREQRTTKVAAMKDLVETAAAAGRDLTADESKQFDALKAEERSLSTQIERAEFLADAERRSAGTPISDNATADFDRLAGSVSVVKVIRAQMEGRSLDGAEAEYAKEAERRTGRKAQG